jgi:hypothetical protein
MQTLETVLLVAACFAAIITAATMANLAADLYREHRTAKMKARIMAEAIELAFKNRRSR